MSLITFLILLFSGYFAPLEKAPTNGEIREAIYKLPAQDKVKAKHAVMSIWGTSQIGAG